MRFLCCSLLLLVCLGGKAVPQDRRSRQPGVPYTIPQTVFVGDTGRLVFPLSPAFAGLKEETLDGGPQSAPLPVSQPGEPVIIRVELENRGAGPRLLVDFRAFAPGVQRLPPVEIASQRFNTLEVTIASILDAGEDSLVLSPPASSLAVPGTMALIYSAALAFLLLIFALAAGGIWGIPGLRRCRERFRRRRRIRGMEKSRRQLLSKLNREDSGGEEEALRRLSAEFRDFLAFFTGMNCRAMIPAEFLAIPPLAGDYGEPLSGRFLQDLFRRWDTLRFRGGLIERAPALGIFEEVRGFIGALDQAERSGQDGKAPAGNLMPEAGT